jgi:hypothetical protein
VNQPPEWNRPKPERPRQSALTIVLKVIALMAVLAVALPVLGALLFLGMCAINR